jgi:hypothetical protein
MATSHQVIEPPAGGAAGAGRKVAKRCTLLPSRLRMSGILQPGKDSLKPIRPELRYRLKPDNQGVSHWHEP